MRTALAIGLCLIGVVSAAAVESANAEDRPSAQTVRDNYRAQLNDNTVTIMAGSAGGTDLAVVQDIADVLDDGDQLRVVPMVGKGPSQSLKDVLYMRGVDMGVTQANVLKHFAKTGELGPNLESRVAYIAKLFNEELHVLARDEVSDIRALDGKTVNMGPEGNGAEITARAVFDALGIKVREAHLDQADALAKLKAGDIDAMVVVAGKPIPILAHLDDPSGLKFLSVPYAKGLEDNYYPATLTQADYPQLIGDGARVDTVAVCAVLVSFNWDKDSPRTQKLERFVNRFFSNFNAFLQPPRHPKWQQVNFAATLEGWQRSPLSQAWIDHAKTALAADPNARAQFETFLAQADTKAAPMSDAERAKLFRAFLDWSKTHGQN
jgi:TRAP transporter TAXI family solute receptor